VTEFRQRSERKAGRKKKKNKKDSKKKGGRRPEVTGLNRPGVTGRRSKSDWGKHTTRRGDPRRRRKGGRTAWCCATAVGFGRWLCQGLVFG